MIKITQNWLLSIKMRIRSSAANAKVTYKRSLHTFMYVD